MSNIKCITVDSLLFIMKFRTVFLVYKSRSGSTFLARQLENLAECLIIPETNFIPYILNNFHICSQDVLINGVLSETKFKDLNISKDELNSIYNDLTICDAQNYISQIIQYYHKREQPNAKIVIIKKGGWYSANMPLLKNIWPDARFLILDRHPCGIYNSAKKSRHSDTAEFLESNPIIFALRWRKYRDNVLLAKKIMPASILVVNFKSLLENTEDVVSTICNFLMVNRTIDYSRHKTRLINPRTEHLHNLVESKPVSQRIDAWRNELSKLDKILIALLCNYRGLDR